MEKVYHKSVAKLIQMVSSTSLAYLRRWIPVVVLIGTNSCYFLDAAEWNNLN